MINVHIMETFNPLKKFYQSQSAIGKSPDKATKEPPKQKEMVQLV